MVNSGRSDAACRRDSMGMVDASGALGVVGSGRRDAACERSSSAESSGVSEALGLVVSGRIDAACRSKSVSVAKVSEMAKALRVGRSGRKWVVLK